MSADGAPAPDARLEAMPDATVIPLHPAASVATLTTAMAHAAAALGWRAVTQPPAALHPDSDRVVVAYDTSTGGAELVDDGVLRTLHLRGDAAQQAATLRQLLPSLDTAAVQTLLASRDPRLLVAGIRAAPILADPVLGTPLALLRRHPDAAVVEEARAALVALLPVLSGTGAALIDGWIDRHAVDGSDAARSAALTALLMPVRVRRQTLRRLLADGDDGVVLQYCSDALLDPDWEVQAGAIIGIGRRRLMGLGPQLERWQPPAAARDLRAPLRAFARASLAELLGTGEPPDRGQPDFAERLASWRHLRALVAGRDGERRDDAWRLARSLTLAHPEPHVAEGWATIGNAAHGIGPDHALRIVTGSGRIAVAPVARAGALWRASVAEVEGWCAANGCTVPTPEAWECAARGCDARVFAWGVGIDADARTASSPWGCTGYGSGPEWARDSDGRWWRCGGEGAVPCWYRVPAQPDERALFRPYSVSVP